MLCRDISCQEQSVLKRIAPLDAQCLPREGTIADCYSVYVKLTLLEGANLSETFLQAGNVTRDVLEEFIRFIPYLNYMLEEVQVYMKYLHSRGTKVIQYLVIKMTISGLSYGWFYTLSDLVSDLHNNGTFIVTNGNFNLHFVSEMVAYSPINHQGTVLYAAPSHNTTVDVLSRGYEATLKSENQCNETTLFTKLHICPFVEIEMNELSTKFENDFLIIEDTTPQIILSEWEYERHDAKIRVCLDDFQSIYNTLPWSESTDRNVATEAISVTGVLSLVCVCLSISSLLVTISIYVVLPKLQTQPGINNVMLCISLLLAQAVYQFGAGQRSTSALFCSIIGALCHFLWLCVMFSMNTCSIQMFTIFKNNIRSLHKFRWKDTVRSVLYVTISSLIFVGINLTVSIIRSNGQDSGYGGSICYLSSPLMHLITFIVPTATAVIVNIILFTYVVFKINNTNRQGLTLNQERNYFAIYARLSTLTGLTWLFGYIHILLENKVIEYLFIVLNACQGVFIMIAFVLNRRVYSLFRARGTVHKTATITTHSEGTGSAVVEEKKVPCTAKNPDEASENKFSHLN